MQHLFLPIAERELRAASRRKVTRRLRWWVALLGIAASLIWFGWAPVATLPAKFIGSLFTVQTACAFCFAFLAGPFLTCDCLSEEKRDGTLGLLFLTDLKARGILLGKFAGTSVNGMYALLGLVPVTAVPLLLGGVGLAEFWRMALALANAMFFSLALGLCVSAFVTDYSRGLTSTLGLLALFGAVLPAVAELGSMVGGSVPWSWFAWFSPYYPFRCARDVMYVLGPRNFWVPLLVSHLLGWVFLALASSGLRRSWQGRDARPKAAVHLPKSLCRVSAATSNERSSDKPFDPMVRLVGEMSSLRWAVWLIVVAWGTLLCVNRFRAIPGLGDLFGARACAFLLKVLVAFQACRFFVETRRSGALELLFCTPLRNADLIRAQWRALLRVFFWPLTIFLVLSWADVAFPLHPAAVSSLRGPPLDDFTGFKTGYLGVFFLGIGLAADVLALGWFGMWLALTLRKPGLAPALTIVAVLILPAMLSSFDLVADMLFVSWGTTRFQEEFRWQIATPVPIPA